MFLLPTNALLYYTYKMLKYTVKTSHYLSYMFRSIWTIIRELMPNLARVTMFFKDTSLNVHKLHGTQYTPQLETLLPTLLNI